MPEERQNQGYIGVMKGHFCLAVVVEEEEELVVFLSWQRSGGWDTGMDMFFRARTKSNKPAGHMAYFFFCHLFLSLISFAL
jgi:hypothetical protein